MADRLKENGKKDLRGNPSKNKKSAETGRSPPEARKGLRENSASPAHHRPANPPPPSPFDLVCAPRPHFRPLPPLPFSLSPPSTQAEAEGVTAGKEVSSDYRGKSRYVSTFFLLDCLWSDINKIDQRENALMIELNFGKLARNVIALRGLQRPWFSKTVPKF